MQTKLGTIVAVNMLCGLLPAYVAATSINASMSESQIDIQAPSPNSAPPRIHLSLHQTMATLFKRASVRTATARPHRPVL